jgi:hypothetical protein
MAFRERELAPLSAWGGSDKQLRERLRPATQRLPHPPATSPRLPHEQGSNARSRHARANVARTSLFFACKRLTLEQ